MWLDSSFSLTVGAETSEYQQTQEFVCRVLTTLAQDLSKKKAFPVKLSCAQFYFNDITDMTQQDFTPRRALSRNSQFV